MSDQDFLKSMARASEERLLAARNRLSENALLRQAMATAPPPPLVRNTGGFDLIAELKLRSPAAGQLRARGEDVAGRVTGYARAGAAAVSVLTEAQKDKDAKVREYAGKALERIQSAK